MDVSETSASNVNGMYAPYMPHSCDVYDFGHMDAATLCMYAAYLLHTYTRLKVKRLQPYCNEAKISENFC